MRLVLSLAVLLALPATPLLAAERGVTFAPPGGGGGYNGYPGGNWNSGGGAPQPCLGCNGGGQWHGGGNNQPPVFVQPYVDVPITNGQPQGPMPPGAPRIPPDQVQAIVGSAGYAQVTPPKFSQGYYYVYAQSAEGRVLLAVDAYSGQVVSSRPAPSTPRPPVVESGSLIGSGSLVGTPPPTVPRGPLAPDPNNPDGE
ncbi:hypothetical protein GCM10007301_55010 [Azorhizobium oxalatiphilum]|uniref:PepSY domain-containing protein n=2 Tax=Azorhizobium oxalatiphilum TaxID=980631 RepID=A0A917CIS3_9HYPH|nr:hypothetical protein GCM10007301_55010 [Azorhizobium oxalatiphilum]